MQTMTTRTVFRSAPARALEKTAFEIALQRSHKRWLVGLFLSSTFGLLAGIFGLAFSALYALGALETSGHISGEITLLLVASFPLLFLSAHSLDRIREIERKIKLEYCKRLGYKDDPSPDNHNEI